MPEAGISGFHWSAATRIAEHTLLTHPTAMSRSLLLLVVTVLMAPARLHAQALDSLWAVWNNKELPDTARMQAMDYLTFDHYMYRDPDTAYVLAGLVLELAERVGNKRYQAWAFNAQGASLHTRGDYPEALIRFRKCLRVLEESGDLRRQIVMHSNIGNIMHEMGDDDEALVHFSRSLEIGERAHLEATMAGTLINRAAILRERGDTIQALTEYERSVQLNDSAAEPRNRAIALSGVGTLLTRSGEYQRAQGCFARCRVIAELLDDDDLRAMTDRNEGSLALRQGRNKEALTLGKRSLGYAQAAGLAWEISQSAGLIYSAYRAMGESALALPAYELAIRTRDSLRTADDRIRFVRDNMRLKLQERVLTDSLQHANELSQAEQTSTIERLRADRNRNRAWGFAGLALLLALIALLLLRGLRTRQRLALKEKELHGEQVDQLLSQQEIRSINAMLEGQEKERDRVGKDLHDRLGSMLGGIKAQLGALEDRVVQVQEDAQFKKAQRLLDETVGELRQISHDMAASTLSRFGLEKALKDLRDTLHISGRLSVELSMFGMEQRLERSVEIAVYRIIQELVSNALKHAKATELSIDVNRSPGRLSLIVIDNGIGFDPTPAAEGMGLTNVRSRAASLGGKVQVDSSPRAGTTISVECPIIE